MLKDFKQVLTAQDRHGILIKVGSIGKDSQGNRVYSPEGIASSQVAGGGGMGGKTGLYIENCRIRRLTPLESFRLMGFDNEDYYKCKSIGISDSQLFKVAGNSIVVNVLEAIFTNLFLKS